MAGDSLIRCKPVGFKEGENSKKHYKLNETFSYRLRMVDWHKRIEEEIEKESSVDTVSNMFRLRRIFQTPTLTFFAPL